MTGATRGRPRVHDDEAILRAALTAFAAHGFDGMSLRALNTELGLANGTINQRFASKRQLFEAAVEHGFSTFFREIAAERAKAGPADDPLDELREGIRAFLRASAKRPELGRLMNLQGLLPSEQLDHLVEHVVLPATSGLTRQLRDLAAAGRIRPVSTRALFFLVGHGAEAPYTLTALSTAFDGTDGPLDVEAHADAMTDLLMRGLRPD